MAVPFERGESAIAVPVAAAEPFVSSWRARLDSSAAFGVPAHVTILYPFLQESLLTASVLEQLRIECRATVPFEVTFARTDRFTTVVYLVPEPTAPFRELTARLARRWPDVPPYGGRHHDVVPHLTVAEGTDPLLSEVERAVGAGLPFSTIVDAAEVYVFDGARFEVRARLPFRRPGAAS